MQLCTSNLYQSEHTEEESGKEVFPTALLHHISQTIFLSSSDGKTQEEDESIVEVVSPVHQRISKMLSQSKPNDWIAKILTLGILREDIIIIFWFQMIIEL